MVRLKDDTGRRKTNALVKMFKSFSKSNVDTETDEPALTRVSAPGERPLSLKLTFLNDRPAFIAPVANYISSNTRIKSESTLDSLLKHLRYFFEGFVPIYEKLREVEILDFADFSKRLIDDYVRWMDGDKAMLSNLELAPDTKILRFLAIRNLWNWYSALPNRPDSLPVFPFGDPPWQRSRRGEKTASALTFAEVAQLRRACISEIQRTFDLIDLGAEAIATEADTNIHSASAEPFLRLEACVAAASRALGFLTDKQQLSLVVGLTRSMRSPHHTIKSVFEQIFLMRRSLVPFVLLFALETGYNTSTLLGLEWGQIVSHGVV